MLWRDKVTSGGLELTAKLKKSEIATKDVDLCPQITDLLVSPKPSLILIINLPSLDSVSIVVKMFRLNSGPIVTSSNSLDDPLTG